jgi:DNA-binding transcriptional LysR family regulator
LTDAASSIGSLLRQHVKTFDFGNISMTSTGSAEGVKRAVAADADALGILPNFAVEEELEQGALLRVFLAPPLPSLHLKALLPRGQRRSATVQDILEVLRVAGGRGTSSSLGKNRETLSGVSMSSSGSRLRQA